MSIAINLLKQFIGTFLQSMGYLKSGNVKGAFYWFYVRNRASLVGSRAGTAKKSYNLTRKLCSDSYQVLPSLSKSTVAALEKHFLVSQDDDHSNLKRYFDCARKAGVVRPEGVDIFLNQELMSRIFEELNLIPKVKEFLNLHPGKIHFNAKIDALVRLDGARNKKNGYDDSLEFHRDVDSLSFVKAFAYLVDVEKGSGEHYLCSGSHRNLPLHLRLISRFSQAYLENTLSNFNLKCMLGKAGYSWIENTTAFHRGSVPTIGDRLMLSLSSNDSISIEHLEDGQYYKLEKLKLDRTSA